MLNNGNAKMKRLDRIATKNNSITLPDLMTSRKIVFMLMSKVPEATGGASARDVFSDGRERLMIDPT
ncbi:hypothetical protein [Agrobacterium larrymoorei]|uniref:hypothetical protein n=1 Tax=Agrobacterium larrymoorei TaxID=160699 RepID=UPI00286D4941|nr:hypothetical protein [Agrobacterium larrymoorei]